MRKKINKKSIEVSLDYNKLNDKTGDLISPVFFESAVLLIAYPKGVKNSDIFVSNRKFFVELSCTIYLLLSIIIIDKQGKICYNIDTITQLGDQNGSSNHQENQTFRRKR